MKNYYIKITNKHTKKLIFEGTTKDEINDNWFWGWFAILGNVEIEYYEVGYECNKKTIIIEDLTS